MRKAWEMLLWMNVRCVCEGGGGVGGEGGSGVRGVQIQVRTQKIYKYMFLNVYHAHFIPPV